MTLQHGKDDGEGRGAYLQNGVGQRIPKRGVFICKKTLCVVEKNSKEILPRCLVQKPADCYILVETDHLPTQLNLYTQEQIM